MAGRPSFASSGPVKLHQCALCNATDVTLSKCAKCLVTYYCSRDHQVQDWGRHKTECKELAAKGAASLQESVEQLSLTGREFASYARTKQRAAPDIERCGLMVGDEWFGTGDMDEVAEMVPFRFFKSGHGKGRTRKKKKQHNGDDSGDDDDDDRKAKALSRCMEALHWANPLDVFRILVEADVKPKVSAKGGIWWDNDMSAVDEECALEAADLCEQLLQCRMGDGRAGVGTVEGQGKWANVIRWEPGMGLADLPSHRGTHGDSEFPPRLSTAVLHVLGCEEMAPAARTAKGTNEDAVCVRAVRKRGQVVLYYGKDAEEWVGYMVAPGDVVLLYPGTYMREIWADNFDVPIEVIGVNGPRDQVVIKHDESAEWGRFINLTPQRRDEQFAYRFANLTLKGSNWEGIMMVVPGGTHCQGMTRDFRAQGHVEVFNCVLRCEEQGVQVSSRTRMLMVRTTIEGSMGEGLRTHSGADVIMYDCVLEGHGRGAKGIMYKGQSAAVVIEQGAVFRAVNCKFAKNHGHAVQMDEPAEADTRNEILLEASNASSGLSLDDMVELREANKRDKERPTVCELTKCMMQKNALCTPTCPSVMGSGACAWHAPSTPLGRRLAEDDAKEERERILHAGKRVMSL